jgi:UDP-N-acetylmuramoyl-tripeptide--D-alanyl-D-alanine ligase
MGLSARDIAAATGGDVVGGDPDAHCASFAIDSRVLAPGACFVALVAARDGHDYVHDAFASGATIALVGRELPGVTPGAGQALVRVADPLHALQQLAAAARAAMDRGPVVGITGSVGKTGTKDLTAAALAPRYAVHASPGSFNNEAGVPLTLLHAPAQTEAIVLEMGARFPGNIAELCVIARPTAGVITRIGMAHAGLLGGPEGVARTKGELLEALGAQGLAVLDADDPFTSGLRARTAARVLTVSANEGADLRAHRIELDDELRPTFLLETPWGSGPVHLAVRGAHQVTNAALAAAVGLAHGVPLPELAESLGAVEPAPWRMEVTRAPSGALVIDDSYNANPSSTNAAVGALGHVSTAGRRIAVLGEMLELGDHSEEEHTALGRLVAERGIDVLVVVGDEAAPAAAAARSASVGGGGNVEVHEVADAAAAAALVAPMVHDHDVVLVKGSRAVGLEAVAAALIAPEQVIS